MLVRDAMTSGAETIGPDATIEAAARKMKDEGIGALVVRTRDQRLVGILTDRDIVMRVIAEGRNPARTKVRSAMTPQLVECLDDETLEAAAMRMEHGAVRRVAVLDAAERLVGMLSVDDVALKSPALAGEIVEHVRAPERPTQRGPWPWWEEAGVERQA
jgi:CBS domain-containing protein